MAEGLSDDIQDIEFEIRRISGGRFEALLHIHRPDRDLRLGTRSYELEQYPLGTA